MPPPVGLGLTDLPDIGGGSSGTPAPVSGITGPGVSNMRKRNERLREWINKHIVPY
jgi:hypothetical protein